MKNQLLKYEHISLKGQNMLKNVQVFLIRQKSAALSHKKVVKIKSERYDNLFKQYFYNILKYFVTAFMFKLFVIFSANLK